VAARRHENCSS